jgi:hypothetical protein
VLSDVKLEELAVRTVRAAKRVDRVGVRLVVLFLGKELLCAALLELGVARARLLGKLHQLLCEVEVAHVVAADLCDNLAALIFEVSLREVGCARDEAEQQSGS